MRVTFLQNHPQLGLKFGISVVAVALIAGWLSCNKVSCDKSYALQRSYESTETAMRVATVGADKLNSKRWQTDAWTPQIPKLEKVALVPVALRKEFHGAVLIEVPMAGLNQVIEYEWDVATHPDLFAFDKSGKVMVLENRWSGLGRPRPGGARY
jgi:hypothetical protein